MTITRPAPAFRSAVTASASRREAWTRRPLLLTVGLACMVASLLTGCSTTPPSAPPLMLSGPDTNIIAAIPAGWHQVINTDNPVIPEMVTPINCMGAQEVACATGLARIATTTAHTPEKAAIDVAAAVTSGSGVTPGPVTSNGAALVGQRDGHRHRFTFTNNRGPQTAEVAAVASGPTTPDAQGNREYSVVLIWIANRPEALAGATIDQVVDSVLVHGGESRR